MTGLSRPRSDAAAEAIQRRPWLALAAFVAVTLGFGLLAGSASETGAGSWYVGLDKPATTPADWVFPVAWTTLYILMGIACWRVWRRAGWRGSRWPLGLFAVQFAANLAWTPAFFGLRSLVGGAAWIVVVDLLAIAATVVFWRRDRGAGLLMLPYLAWLAWATMVAWQTWALNA